MDRERDRDVVEDMIEEQDAKQGREPDRERPGRHDTASRPVDGQTPPTETKRKPAEEDAPKSPDPGPFAPH